MDKIVFLKNTLLSCSLNEHGVEVLALWSAWGRSASVLTTVDRPQQDNHTKAQGLDIQILHVKLGRIHRTRPLVI